MNKHTLLRILCGLTFLIFLCPFYQACSNEQLDILSNYNKQQEELLTDTVDVVTITDTIVEKGKIRIVERKDTVYTKISMPKELQKEWLKDKEDNKKGTILNLYDLNIVTLTEGLDYVLLPFNFTLFLAAFQLIMAFCNRFNAVFNLTFLSCIITVFFGFTYYIFASGHFPNKIRLLSLSYQYNYYTCA